MRQCGNAAFKFYRFIKKVNVLIIITFLFLLLLYEINCRIAAIAASNFLLENFFTTHHCKNKLFFDFAAQKFGFLNINSYFCCVV